MVSAERKTLLDLETPVVVTVGKLGQVPLKSNWPKLDHREGVFLNKLGATDVVDYLEQNIRYP